MLFYSIIYIYLCLNLLIFTNAAKLIQFNVIFNDSFLIVPKASEVNASTLVSKQSKKGNIYNKYYK